MSLTLSAAAPLASMAEASHDVPVVHPSPPAVSSTCCG